MQVAFERVKPKPGSRFAGKNLIQVYRHVGTQKATEWVDVGYITSPEFVDNKPFALSELQVIMHPSGTWTFINPSTHAKVNFMLGKENITGKTNK